MIEAKMVVINHNSQVQSMIARESLTDQLAFLGILSGGRRVEGTVSVLIIDFPAFEIRALGATIAIIVAFLSILCVGRRRIRYYFWLLIFL